MNSEGPTTPSTRFEQLLDELIRLQVLELKARADSQAVLIDDLLDAGFEPPRIAQLIGTTPATVRARRAKGKK